MDSLSAELKEIEAKSNNDMKYNISLAVENRFEEIITFIRGNFSEPINREDLAETVGVNPNSFNSLFKIYTGNKINDHRLAEASVVPTDQNLSIIDVAFYLDLMNLCMVFPLSIILLLRVNLHQNNRESFLVIGL